MSAPLTPESTGRVVVAGGGVAGHIAATTLRAEGFAGTIELLTPEGEPPYDRPPLSKEALLGDDAAAAEFKVDYGELDIRVTTDAAVTAIASGEVRSTQGAHPYDGLILATGSVPVLLPGQADSPRALALRTRADATRLRGCLLPGSRVVIVGAGWIGAEVATAAVRHGCRVTVIDGAESPLAAALPGTLGQRTVAWYEEVGVRLSLGTPVKRIREESVELATGVEVAADVIVVGVGVRPATDYLRDSELSIDVGLDGSVSVDDQLRVGTGRIYAAGDIVRWPSRRFGRSLRVEHWDHAVASARQAARNLLGGSEIYDPVPYVWSDQFGRRVQYVGRHAPEDRLVIREVGEGDGWSAWWLNGAHLTAALAVDQPRLIRTARKAIGSGATVDEDTLPNGLGGTPGKQRPAQVSRSLHG